MKIESAPLPNNGAARSLGAAAATFTTIAQTIETPSGAAVNLNSLYASAVTQLDAGLPALRELGRSVGGTLLVLEQAREGAAALAGLDFTTARLDLRTLVSDARAWSAAAAAGSASLFAPPVVPTNA